jgi:hypothetical protein
MLLMGSALLWISVRNLLAHGAPRVCTTLDEAPSGTTGTYYLPYASSAPRDVGFVIRTGQVSTAALGLL